MQDRTTQYAADVLAGKITAGEMVKLACKRHMEDLEASKAARIRCRRIRSSASFWDH